MSEDVTEFRGSYAGIGEMLNSPMVAAALLKRAERVKGRCEDTAPVGDPAEPDDHAGRYKAGFRVAIFPKRNGRRPEAYVVNGTPDAFWVEYGHSGAEPYHTMHRALLEAGE
jgi:hypothetical protein